MKEPDVVCKIGKIERRCLSRHSQFTVRIQKIFSFRLHSSPLLQKKNEKPMELREEARRRQRLATPTGIWYYEYRQSVTEEKFRRVAVILGEEEKN